MSPLLLLFLAACLPHVEPRGYPSRAVVTCHVCVEYCGAAWCEGDAGAVCDDPANAETLCDTNPEAWFCEPRDWCRL